MHHSQPELFKTLTWAKAAAFSDHGYCGPLVSMWYLFGPHFAVAQPEEAPVVQQVIQTPRAQPLLKQFLVKSTALNQTSSGLHASRFCRGHRSTWLAGGGTLFLVSRFTQL